MDTEVTLGDVDLNTVKARSLTGVATLISRSIGQKTISVIGFGLLSAFLGVAEVGVFIAINELVSILSYFSDIGLAASLIQKKEKVSETDLRTTFTIQQFLVVTLIIIMIIASPKLFSYYHIQGPSAWLFFSLMIAFFLASLKTIPSVVLERQLKFEIIAAVEIFESLVFYSVAVFLAWKGAGVLAYAWAVLLRGIVGTGLIYYMAPWNIGFQFSKSSLKSLLSFGIPFQVNSLMAVVKDRFVNIALWKIIGASGVGVIGWAQTWSQLPLRFIMDNVTKVTFPAYARLQDHPEELKQAIEKTLFFITALTFPLLAGMAILTPVVIGLIPNYQKWEIGLIALVLFCFNSAFAAVSTPLTGALNAIGKVKINTYLMIMWTVLTWVLTPYLAMKYGFNGVAYATALIAFSSVVPIIIVKKLTGFSLSKSIGKTLAASLIMVVICFFLKSALSPSYPNLAVNIVASGLVYLCVLVLLVGQSLVADSRKIMYAFLKKS